MHGQRARKREHPTAGNPPPTARAPPATPRPRPSAGPCTRDSSRATSRRTAPAARRRSCGNRSARSQRRRPVPALRATRSGMDAGTRRRAGPLAELVRVQCALARGGRTRGAPLTPACTARRSRGDLARPAARRGRSPRVVARPAWRRRVAGFLRAHADLVTARCVRFVDVSDWSAQLGAERELTASADLRAVTSLEIRGRYPIGDAGLAAIAHSTYLAGLRSLQLRGCRYGAAGFAGPCERGDLRRARDARPHRAAALP
jgi:hypothetical protein